MQTKSSHFNQFYYSSTGMLGTSPVPYQRRTAVPQPWGRAEMIGKTRWTILLFTICMLSFCHVSWAKDGYHHIESALIEDGTTLVYSYIDGSAYRVGFYNDGSAGRIHWMAIKLEFSEDGDIAWKPHIDPIQPELSSGRQHLYRAKKLDEGVYWVFWPYDPEEAGSKELITLRIDFNTREIFASSLFNYGKNKNEGNHALHFVPGVIHKITRR